MTAERILEIARGELGVKESPAGSNKVKYNTAYGAGNVPWCAVFVWWVFRRAGASDLYYGGGKTAYCPTLLSYHRGLGQGVHGDYRPGDIIFFNFSGSGGISHVGICENWDGAKITTIDGNTGAASQANGGAVLRQTRNKKYIVGAYRPAYEKGEMDLTEEQTRIIVREELEALLAQRDADQPSEKWQVDGVARAKELGISDGTRPMGLATRVEAMIMAANAAGK